MFLFVPPASSKEDQQFNSLEIDRKKSSPVSVFKVPDSVKSVNYNTRLETPSETDNRLIKLIKDKAFSKSKKITGSSIARLYYAYKEALNVSADQLAEEELCWVPQVLCSSSNLQVKTLRNRLIELSNRQVVSEIELEIPRSTWKVIVRPGTKYPAKDTSVIQVIEDDR